MNKKENNGPTCINSRRLDRISDFAIISLAKTTRSDPFGHGGF
jgi:hypothetical protein